MIILILCLIIIIIIGVYLYHGSSYDISWMDLRLSKSDKLENNCFTILKNMSLMNHNKQILIPSYFSKPTTIVSSSQLLCLKFTFGNYIWINFAGTYMGPTLINAFDLRYTYNSIGFKVHRGFYNVYMKNIKPKINQLLELDEDTSLPKNNKKIIISGYSLGGVLAILLLCDIIDKKYDDKIIKCITFGTPKFGCKKMYEYFSKYEKLLRIEYTHDKIPKFSARGFYNIGIKKKFNLENNIPGIINTHYYSYEKFYQ